MCFQGKRRNEDQASGKTKCVSPALSLKLSAKLMLVCDDTTNNSWDDKTRELTPLLLEADYQDNNHKRG